MTAVATAPTECTPAEAAAAVSAGAVLVDVRTGPEYREVHAEGVVHIPLDRIDAAAVRRAAGDKPVVLLCRSGARARQACERLAAQGLGSATIVKGGTMAWADAGLPVVRGPKAMSLERQVRIAAGTLVLTGVVLGVTVHPGFLGISGFVGCGLIFAGITDWCGMGLLLARMPWNR